MTKTETWLHRFTVTILVWTAAGAAYCQWAQNRSIAALELRTRRLEVIGQMEAQLEVLRRKLDRIEAEKRDARPAARPDA